MPPKLTYSLLTQETKTLVNLAAPMVATGLIESTIGFTSTLFLARLGARELAAGALVSWLFVTLMVIMWGTLSAISVLIARHFGAKDEKGISNVLRDSFFLGLLFTLPAMLLLWFTPHILLLLGQRPPLVALAHAYLHGLMWGVFPDFMFMVLQQFIVGLGHARTNMFFTILWVPLNIFLNYILIFGKLGLPALGIAGIGWGTSLSFWIISTLMAIYIFSSNHYRSYLQGVWHWHKPVHLIELVRVGMPMGVMYCVEIGYFMVLAFLMGHLGSKVLAANQITMQYLWFTSVLSACIAQAVTVRMGHMLGAGETAMAKYVAYIGSGLAISCMVLVAMVYWLFPKFIIAFDLNLRAHKNQYIIAMASQFLAICAIFQLLEALRLSMFGALRALKDTRFTLFVSTVCFWFIALPIGHYLATHLHLGGPGLWWGMVMGAVVSSTLLFWRFSKYFSISTASWVKE